MIDIDVTTSVSDGKRRFDLAMRFTADVPVVALYGPSGAGKSLTLQTIAGLHRPDAGHVRIGGHTLFNSRTGVDQSPTQRRVGYLFQHYALFAHLSVRDNVGFGLTSWLRPRLSRQNALRVDELLESFGLADLAHSRPATLSGGQQQRVALARALACEPAVLLLDEPFAALNPMLRQQLRAELKQVCQRWETPVVMITHDIDDVLALADVAFVVKNGQAVREVHVHDGVSRNLVLQTLLPGCAAAPASASATAVRRLLGEPGFA